MIRVRDCACIAALAVIAGCEHTPPIIVDPSTASVTLAAQLRQEMSIYGAVAIGPMPAENPALVALGQALVFDKILSGNRDISCATCHQLSQHGADGLSLSIGTGGTGLGAARTLGAGRQFIPRNSPSLLNQGLRSPYIFWDGRVSGNGAGPFIMPTGIIVPGPLPNILAAQAMLPVLNRDEMRGKAGDVDVNGATNELAQVTDGQFPLVWQAIMTRLLAIPEYRSLFAAAFPTFYPNVGFQHAATAMAEFIAQKFAKYDSPFDRFLARDDNAMEDAALRGGLLFFGRAQCSSCHFGALLGGSNFSNTGIPQVGPGTGTAAPLDLGRGGLVNPGLPGPGPGPGAFSNFSFRAPALRNVELTAPYMHNGAFATLENVVKHYNDARTSLATYDVTQLAPELRGAYRGDSATIAQINLTLDFRMRTPRNFTEGEKADLVAFLKSLTDPAARDLGALMPSSVPSGLPVP